MQINILIRTSYRPESFKRALASVKCQTHKNIRIIVSYDNHNALKYIPEDIQKIRVFRGQGKYFYDEYCNILKSLVTEGYFMFLDDDDILSSPDIIERLLPLLSPEHGQLVQLKRNSTICPNSISFSSGKIGMPCLILHHSHKGLADITVDGAGDYVWINKVSKLLPLKFEPLIVVESFNRGNGKLERPQR